MTVLRLCICLLAAVPASAAQEQAVNQCVQCHFRLAPTPVLVVHLDEWSSSAHARAGIGCERCHGGNEKATAAVDAHRGVLNSRNPSSTVYWRNLPGTCGGCHTGELGAFAKSAHQQLLDEGDPFVPVCSTCHGSMAALTPSPFGLELRCARCHGRPVNGVDRAKVARQQTEQIHDVRVRLRRAGQLIGHPGDSSRQRALAESHRQAEVSLASAVYAVHAFDPRLVTDRLAVATRQTTELLRALEGAR